MANNEPASPFSAYAAIPPSPAASPRIEAGGYRSPSRFGTPGQGLQGSGSEAAHRLKSLRLTPRPLGKSLDNMLQDQHRRNEASQEGQRRRDLQATRSGLEVNAFPSCRNTFSAAFMKVSQNCCKRLSRFSK